ncbi:MAG: DUF4367 domain-containing protein [Patescibacteria group bacterium]
MIGIKQTKKLLFLKFNFLQKGTTLLEIIVAIGIFSMIILSATGIFQLVVEGQRNAIAAQNIQENIRYAMETISREIRMAQASSDNACQTAFGFSGNNKIYNTNSNNNVLYFKNKDGECILYSIENNQLIKAKGSLSNSIALTSSKIKINNLKFVITDNSVGNNSIQSRVTMALDIEYIGKKMHKQLMQIQTTVSSRYYE